jgi:hypothetical protein
VYIPLCHHRHILCALCFAYLSVSDPISYSSSSSLLSLLSLSLRARPPTSKEVEQFGNDSICVSFPNPGEVKVFNEKNREKVWEFDEVFDYDSTQEKVYSDVSALVVSVLDGYNVCIFACKYRSSTYLVLLYG